LELDNPAEINIPEGFDFYGITSVSAQYYFAKMILSEIKKRGLGE
jgi:hypothetical protein